MRKRSGAIDSDSHESYIKIATKNPPLHYENEVKSPVMVDFVEVENWERGFSVGSEYQKEKNFSWPPRNEKISFQLPVGGLISQLDSSFKSLSGDVFLHENDHYNTNTHKIMVIGQENIGKKRIVDKLIEQQDSAFPSCLGRKSSRERCLDLIIKQRRIEEIKQRQVFKFWIHNTNQDRFQNIMEVYYKNCNFFIYVISSSCRMSFDLIKSTHKRVSEHNSFIHSSSILVNIVNKHEKREGEDSVFTDEGQSFVSENCFLAYFEVDLDDTSSFKDLNRFLLQIME